MKRLTALTISIAAVLASAAAAVAVATQDDRPKVDPVLATFSFASAHEKQRFCEGEDGPYIEIRAHHEGTQTGDPRLSGDIELEAHNLVNLATGLGTSEGTYTIRDPETNALKVRGRYHGIFTEGSKFHGLAVAHVKDGAGESEQIGLFKADVDLTTGAVSGELGGSSPDARTPAVIRKGACTGPWTLVGR
jgi:hypothetical protein